MLKRVHIEVRGAVQGVGFRPFVYRLAAEYGLAGWVMNAMAGVSIDAEGDENRVEHFLLRLERDKPPRAFIQGFEFSYLDPAGYASFTIRESDGRGERSTYILPDIATCPDCVADISDPLNRRFEYPFTNCTNCGPRFTIVEGLPYDRPRTTMKSFELCDDCRREYEDPLNRRFHAQPNACPICGPHLELWDAAGRVTARHGEALAAAAERLLAGEIVAVKGLGGFHLMVDASNPAAVADLRRRKRREEKPLAIMAPDFSAVQAVCDVSPLEERLLRSPESPIVLLRKRLTASMDAAVCPEIAPGNPTLGVMLPYTPLHHLLLKKTARFLVATSGNLTDEPICTDEQDALVRLSGIAHVFLVHNRPIARYVDDSIVRVLLDRELVLRRSRGYAPLPVAIKTLLPDAIAVGAHLKSTIAISRQNGLFVSQHLGDLETEQSLRGFRTTIRDFERLYDLQPTTVVADLHPDYISTAEARGMGLPVRLIQHHYAHIAACMAENELETDVLGVSWDGTGWGSDGTIWGGEFLTVGKGGAERVGSFRAFPLPGGEAAVKEPRRTALGMLTELFGEDSAVANNLPCIKSFTPVELSTLRRMLERRLNSPPTTSAGRMFDGIAAMLGVRQQTTFEGQAAMELEWLASSVSESVPFAFALGESPAAGAARGMRFVVDWGPAVKEMLGELLRGMPAALLAHRFHSTMARVVLAAAEKIGRPRVVLTGGCFQNALLTTMTVRLLRAHNFLPYWHQRIPPNDGGIALGQLYAALVLEK